MSITDQVLKSIQDRGRGTVVTPKDFLDLGSRAAVDQALSRLARSGRIRRLARGLYDYPRQSPRLGELAPSPDAVARAVARAADSRIMDSGAAAANRLGLTAQVPAKLVYLTDGPSRKVRIGRQVIALRHAAPRTFVGAGGASGTVIQALRHLGRAHIDDAVVQTLRRKLSDDDRRAVARDAIHAPGWMRPILDRLAAPAA